MKPMALTNEQIAQLCHEANRALCRAFGDDSQPPWSEAPDWQRASAEAGIAFARSHPSQPSAQHESWCASKKADGWVYGAVKDAVAKTHPCLVPYEQLPPEQKAKDHLFQAIVRTAVSL